MNSLYEEYMRNVLGFDTQNTYNMYSSSNINQMNVMNNIQQQELENCYPDIYRIVYPMVQKACMNNTRMVNKELIDELTDEIYFSVEDNELTENRSSASKNTEIQTNSSRSENRQIENRQRNIRNPGLNNLIRILLLREFLGRPGRPGHRPPMGPPRPPMGPPMSPPPRPKSNFYNDLFE